MDIIASFFICFALFITSVLKGIFVGYALFAGLVIFTLLAVKRGYSFSSVIKMIYKGGKRSFIVLQIFVLIGAIISLWMSSGTVPAIVYYGLRYLNPRLFILSAFLISAAVSLLIGTSFGTIGTAGVALMVMARSSGTSIPVTAGAIIAGAYFGDRCSPMSSSANLVAHLTETELYTNIRNMIKTSIIPAALTIIIYGVLSFKYPLAGYSSAITNDIEKYFNIGMLSLMPAIIICILSILRVKVKISMLVSIASAAVIAVLLQGNSAATTIKHAAFGYTMNADSSLSEIIKGGGILSMLKLALVVFISSGFTGIFEETGMLNSIEKLTMRARSRAGVFAVTILISIVTAAFGCTQVLAVILTNMLMKKVYKEKNIPKEVFAVNIENTAIVVAPLIPWNIAVLVPLITLNAGFNSILYCVYLYLVPLVNLANVVFKERKKSNINIAIE